MLVWLTGVAVEIVEIRSEGKQGLGSIGVDKTQFGGLSHRSESPYLQLRYKEKARHP